MKNELFIPKSASLKHVFRKYPRSVLATWYLWFSLGFHVLVLLRAGYLIWKRTLPFQDWDSNQKIIIYLSIFVCIITILSFRFFRTILVYAVNLLYHGAFLLDGLDWSFVGGATGNENLILSGQEDMVRLGFLFVILHLFIIPIYIVVRPNKSMKHQS